MSALMDLVFSSLCARQVAASNDTGVSAFSDTATVSIPVRMLDCLVIANDRVCAGIIKVQDKIDGQGQLILAVCVWFIGVALRCVAGQSQTQAARCVG